MEIMTGEILVRGPALSEEIRNYIKNHILTNQMKPGDLLPPENQLMADLGVGRSSVREAVKALQSLGIVEVQRGNGLYVRQANFDPILESLSYNMRFDPRIFAEVLEIRVWLESAVIEDAVMRINDEDIVRLEDVLRMWEQRIALAEHHAALDQQFHDILYAPLKNRTLVQLFQVFWLAFNSLDDETIQSGDPALGLTEHRDIFAAVKSRNPVLARQRLLAHFSHVQQRIERATGQD